MAKNCYFQATGRSWQKSGWDWQGRQRRRLYCLWQALASQLWSGLCLEGARQPTLPPPHLLCGDRQDRDARLWDARARLRGVSWAWQGDKHLPSHHNGNSWFHLKVKPDVSCPCAEEKQVLLSPCIGTPAAESEEEMAFHGFHSWDGNLCWDLW